MSSEQDGAAGVEGILERLRRLKDARLAPFELVEAAVALQEHLGVEEAARRLDVSVPHLGNLVRLRRQLVPAAWARFASMGHAARLRSWIKIAALPSPGQVAAAKKEQPVSSCNPTGELEPDDYQGIPGVAVGTRLAADGPAWRTQDRAPTGARRRSGFSTRGRARGRAAAEAAARR